jgi:hypothetical protein
MLPSQREQGRTYRADVTAAIDVIAASLNYPYAERLTPNLKWQRVPQPSRATLSLVAYNTVRWTEYN